MLYISEALGRAGPTACPAASRGGAIAWSNLAYAIPGDGAVAETTQRLAACAGATR